MAWITLNKTHIESRLAAEELACIEATGGGSGDRLTGIIEQVTGLVRSKVASCSTNVLGVAGSIREECLHAAVTLAKHDLRASLSTTNDDDSELRRDEYKLANEFLNKVANCEISVVGTSGADGATPSVSNVSGCYGGDDQHKF